MSLFSRCLKTFRVGCGLECLRDGDGNGSQNPSFGPRLSYVLMDDRYNLCFVISFVVLNFDPYMQNQ